MTKPTSKQLKAIRNLSKGLNISILELPKTKEDAIKVISELVKRMGKKMEELEVQREWDYGNEMEF